MRQSFGIKDLGRNFKKKFVLRPMLLIAISFFVVIILGSILLVCPFTHEEGAQVSYVNALFTATTATCVTGLVDLPAGIGATFNLGGEIIILILIQLGGLGVTAVGTFLVLLIFGRVTLGQQQLIKEAWNLSSSKTLKKVFYYTLLITFIVELIGAVICSLSFYYTHNLDVTTSIKNGIFHSVSSFNNAGLDLLGTTSFIYYDDPLLLITTSILIILGGLGYIVIVDIFSKKFNFIKMRAHTKIVLTMTAILLVFGSVFVFLSSYTPNGFAISFPDSMFLSVTSRTAGFSSVDLSLVPTASLIILLLLSFVGACPGGTGGGIKTTTVFVIFAYIRSVFQNKEPHGFKRQINRDTTRKALLIFTVSISLIIVSSIVISVIETSNSTVVPFDWVLFEVTNAFSTTGLSTGVTPSLNEVSRIILILLMYIGRIGPMSIATVLKSNTIQTWYYVEENIPIG